MRSIFAALVLALAPLAAHAQTGLTTQGQTGGTVLKDEGSTQGTVKTLNCTGSGVTCSASGGVGTINVTAGGGAGNFVEISVDLGSSGGEIFNATVSGATWVTSSSIILCDKFATSADGQTVETYAASGITANAATRVAGASFDIWIDSPRGATGIYRFHCTGG